MTIGEMCRCDVVTVTDGASIKEAAQLMKEKNVGSVVVVKDKEKQAGPCGILTDRDVITRLLSEDVAVDQLKVGDVMSQDILLLKESQGVKEVINAMSEKGVRRAPLINEQNNELIGIVTLDDLVVLIADELHHIASLIKRQISMDG